MAVLLLAEINGGELAVDATSKALTAAKTMGDVTATEHASRLNPTDEQQAAWQAEVAQPIYLKPPHITPGKRESLINPGS